MIVAKKLLESSKLELFKGHKCGYMLFWTIIYLTLQIFSFLIGIQYTENETTLWNLTAVDLQLPNKCENWAKFRPEYKRLRRRLPTDDPPLSIFKFLKKVHAGACSREHFVYSWVLSVNIYNASMQSMANRWNTLVNMKVPFERIINNSFCTLVATIRTALNVQLDWK